jgi:hypothetical protein
MYFEGGSENLNVFGVFYDERTAKIIGWDKEGWSKLVTPV